MRAFAQKLHHRNRNTLGSSPEQKLYLNPAVRLTAEETPSALTDALWCVMWTFEVWTSSSSPAVLAAPCLHDTTPRGATCVELRLHFSRTATFDLQTQRNACFCAVELQSVLQLRAAVSSAEPTLGAFVSLMATEQQNHWDPETNGPAQEQSWTHLSTPV